MTPTEHEATVAVDAAARALHQQAFPAVTMVPAYDDLRPLEQNAIRESVLPLVWAALEALPDRVPPQEREAALLARALDRVGAYPLAGDRSIDGIRMWAQDLVASGRDLEPFEEGTVPTDG